MPGPRKGYTTPHRCATVNDSKRNQPSDRDQQARCKVQEKTLYFHANFYDCVYLSIEPEAKGDIYNTFDPDNPISIHLGPPSTERPTLVEIKQKGKTSIYTTDFYFTNKSPSNIVVHLQTKIILHPQEIRQQQQTPLYLTQILYSQARSIYTPGCYIHHKHPFWI